MRVDLAVPFAEKDAVKTLGGRWDSVKRVWYVVNAADMAAFARWLPASGAAAPSAGTARTQPAAETQRPGAIVTRSPRPTQVCHCAVLPWEDCAHTLAA